MDKVVVAGVGMVPFAKPGKSENYQQMGEQAAQLALRDARVDYAAIQQAYVGYVYGDSTCGQAALYGIGLSGIPVVNVNNNCATGSSAVYLARQAVAGGSADCVLALGFEQMVPGALGLAFPDRVSPLFRHQQAQAEVQGIDPAAPMAAQLFGGAGQAYVDEYGIDPALFAHISVKARRHAANNPYAVFREPVTIEQVLGSPVIYGPLTRLLCCPPICGAAAGVVC
jgi:sterol carrier protein 2